MPDKTLESLAVIAELQRGRRYFRLAEYARSVGCDLDSAWNRLQKLARKGFIRRVGKGKYRLTRLGRRVVQELRLEDPCIRRILPPRAWKLYVR